MEKVGYFKIFIIFTVVLSTNSTRIDKCPVRPSISVLQCTGATGDDLPQQPLPQIELLRLINSSVPKIKKEYIKNFPELKNFQAGSSGIETIEDNTFRNMTYLERINISNNKLRRINPDLLQDCPAIFEFDASGNTQLEIPIDKSFLNTPVLTALILSRCKIEKVSSFTFKNLTGLEHLSLAENNIETLPDDVFESLTKLYSIDLSGNKMKTISRQVFRYMPIKGTVLRFARLTTLSFPRLSNNPWECDCALYPMIQWFKEGNQNEELACVKPDTKKWKEIEDLNCSNNNIATES